MRIIANEKHISRREFVGRTANIAGLVVLVVAFIISWIQVSSLWVMQLSLAVALLLGIGFTFVGSYFGDRFGGPNAHHLGVRAALKGLDHQYVLFQYTLPVPHVLLGPDGLTVLVVRSQAGEVTYQEGKWRHRQRAKFLRQLAGQEGIGLPEVEVERQIERLSRYLEKELPGSEVPVQGVVLFIHPQVTVSVEDAPVPVFFGKKVRSWVRGAGARKKLPPPVRQQLEALLVKPEEESETE